MSYNRAPAADLAPWIGRLYATYVDAPADHVLDCGLFNDCSMIRIQLRGKWVAETADGTLNMGRSALLFGPNTRLMPVSVTGGFTSVGLSLRPGMGYALFRKFTADYVDRLAPCEEFGLPVAEALDWLEQCDDGEAALQYVENIMRAVVAQAEGRQPDPVTTAFERITLTNPALDVAECARQCGVDRKRLERLVVRDFGLSPKQVLRRARALDMAAHLRGVADADEANELALRYYDQSHLIREFSELFGMSPRQFVARPLPVLTLALESRQAKRLEALARLAPGAQRPWQ